MKKYLLLFVFLIGCATAPTPQPKEVMFKVESEIPVTLSIYVEKDCTGNINFCKWQ